MHMVLPYHRSDYQKLPDEDKVMATMRAAGLTPGTYHFPHCSHKDMKNPEVVAKQKQGPVGLLTVIPSGPPNMPKYLSLWFVYSLLVSLFVAYLAGRTLASGTDYLQVFRVAGTAAFMSYGLANFADSVWKGQPWSTTLKHMFDGLVYALLTAGVFGWLWPR
jgi:hypothetical protein